MFFNFFQLCLSRVQRIKVFTFSILVVALIVLPMLFVNLNVVTAKSYTIFSDGFELGKFDNANNIFGTTLTSDSSKCTNE
jgi:hypothetical protein